MKIFESAINPKSWVKLLISALCILLAVTGLAAYLLDPCMYYRKPAYRAFINPRYMNKGIIKNHNYDSAIIGSSMIMNFNMDSFREKLGWEPVKLTWGAPTASDMGLLAREAIKYKNPRNILICLDIFTFNNEPGSHRNIPEFLYDENTINDFKYLWGYETWFRFVPIDALINASLNLGMSLPYKFIKESDVEKIGEWKDEFKFGKEYVIKEVRGSAMQWIKKQSSAEYMQRTTENLSENLLDIIKENPDISFYVIFPPYSVLPWVKAFDAGCFEDYMNFKRLACEKLFELKNVDLYDFQSIESIITDLDIYKDPTHYSPEINEYMLDSIKLGNHRVNSSEDIENNILELRKLASRHNLKWYIKH